MATIRTGNQAALLVVDVQVGVVADAWDRDRIVGNVARVVEHARHDGVPVIWILHDDAELPRDSASWQIVPELQPLPGETKIGKHFNSAFEDTGLEQELQRLQVSHLVLAGASTNWCVRATAYAALERGYDLTLVEDAHTTGALGLTPDRRVEARDIIDELNVAMTWLSYPGRRSRTAPAETVEFTAPVDAAPAAA